MPLAQLHKMKLVERKPSDPQECSFLVSCSCDFQGLAHTLGMAESFLNSHIYAQTVRGNNVTIERELLDKPSVVDASKE